MLGSQTLTLADQHFRKFSGVISGTGGVRIPSSTLQLTGANTYTGLTMIDLGASVIIGDGLATAGGSLVGDVLSIALWM